MGMHEQLCLTKEPKLAAWAAALFCAYGLVGLFTLHDTTDTSVIAGICYLVIAVIFLISLILMKCLVERAVCALLTAIYATDLSAVVFRLDSAKQGFVVRAATTSIWFFMALICFVWALRTKASAVH